MNKEQNETRKEIMKNLAKMQGMMTKIVSAPYLERERERQTDNAPSGTKSGAEIVLIGSKLLDDGAVAGVNQQSLVRREHHHLQMADHEESGVTKHPCRSHTHVQCQWMLYNVILHHSMSFSV